LKTYPRPKGRATRVIYTEYDLPRETISPHDVIVDAQGIAWYSSFGEQNLGRLDPKSGRVREFPIPAAKPDFPTGRLGLRSDGEGNLWLGNMYQAQIVKFDRKQQKFSIWKLPPEQNIDAAQVNMVSPQSAHVDGKVWTQNNGFAGVHRLDIASGKIETWEPFKNAPKGEPHNIYDVVPDSQNNAWFTDFRHKHIGRIDAQTGDGRACTGPMLTDQGTRLNTRTGEAVAYLLPRPTNIRRVHIDNSTTPVTFWVGSNHGASVVKVEALD